MPEPALQPFTLPAGTLLPAAEAFRATGDVPDDIGRHVVGALVGEVLTTVAVPVQRLALAARHGDVLELIGGWVGTDVTVLLAHEHTPGMDRVIPIATEHLPLHLALLLDLRPRPVTEVETPIQVPLDALGRILAGGHDEPLPPTLPGPWTAVLRGWGQTPPVVRTLTVGRSEDDPHDAAADDDTPDDAAPDDAAGSATPRGADGSTRRSLARWRTISVIDDPERGLWLADDDLLAAGALTVVDPPRLPADPPGRQGEGQRDAQGPAATPPPAGSVVRLRPTRSFELVDLVSALLRLPPSH